MMFTRDDRTASFHAAFPIMLGYVAIGIPCGILSVSIGMTWEQVLIMSIVLYSGAGQFMIPNMWLAASPVASIVASVSLVNTRQLLYSASLASWCENAPRWLAFWFAATVTDESYGVNMNRFLEGSWTVERATLVNELSHVSWTASAVVGAFVGNAIGIPLAIASFAMTSIFICLLVTQKPSAENVVAAAAAMVGVFLCKLAGFGGAAILLGAVLGVGAGILAARLREEV